MVKMFQPTADWQSVPDGAVLPPGCEIRMSLSTGVNEARLRQLAKPVVVAKPGFVRRILVRLGWC